MPVVYLPIFDNKHDVTFVTERTFIRVFSMTLHSTVRISNAKQQQKFPHSQTMHTNYLDTHSNMYSKVQHCAQKLNKVNDIE